MSTFHVERWLEEKENGSYVILAHYLPGCIQIVYKSEDHLQYVHLISCVSENQEETSFQMVHKGEAKPCLSLVDCLNKVGPILTHKIEIPSFVGVWSRVQECGYPSDCKDESFVHRHCCQSHFSDAKNFDLYQKNRSAKEGLESYLKTLSERIVLCPMSNVWTIQII